MIPNFIAFKIWSNMKNSLIFVNRTHDFNLFHVNLKIIFFKSSLFSKGNLQKICKINFTALIWIFVKVNAHKNLLDFWKNHVFCTSVYLFVSSKLSKIEFDFQFVKIFKTVKSNFLQNCKVLIPFLIWSGFGHSNQHFKIIHRHQC